MEAAISISPALALQANRQGIATARAVMRKYFDWDNINEEILLSQTRAIHSLALGNLCV